MDVSEKLAREMTFEEEAKFYEEEARAEFAKETGNGDSAGVNNILRRGMRIIRKAREKIAHGVTAQEWISVEVDAVKTEKPPAIVYIDDREICFDGNPDNLLNKIIGFEPWYKNTVKTNADRLNAMSIEDKAQFLYSISYAGETPWSRPFYEKFCKDCPDPEYTLDDGRKLYLHECDFKDGECPHGTDIVWWLQQPAEE